MDSASYSFVFFCPVLVKEPAAADLCMAKVSFSYFFLEAYMKSILYSLLFNGFRNFKSSGSIVDNFLNLEGLKTFGVQFAGTTFIIDFQVSCRDPNVFSF